MDLAHIMGAITMIVLFSGFVANILAYFMLTPLMRTLRGFTPGTLLLRELVIGFYMVTLFLLMQQ